MDNVPEAARLGVVAEHAASYGQGIVLADLPITHALLIGVEEFTELRLGHPEMKAEEFDPMGRPVTANLTLPPLPLLR